VLVDLKSETVNARVVMSRKSFALAAALLLASVPGVQAAEWVAGKHYTVLSQAQQTNVSPGKVEVMEVFSYGCPACNHFQPTMKKLRAALPANAQLVYLPASWHPEENWHVFQRSFLTAQALGVAEKAHDAMFDAIWGTGGELAILDSSGRPKKKMPSIDDVALFYQRVAGVKAADFLAASKSFSVETKMRQADSQITAMKVGSTPTLVVAGKYSVSDEKLNGDSQLIELVKFLVAKESAAAPVPKTPAPKKK
jgi:thiol:disulfide interchange protein DsbA